MANTKSSKKDLRRSAKRRIQNQAVRTSLKTYVKKVRTTAATGNADATTAAVNKVQSVLDKAAEHGVIHKNAAARRKSRAAKAANKALQASA
jgi:small subunit ribosomal protein S20